MTEEKKLNIAQIIYADRTGHLKHWFFCQHMNSII